MHRLIFHYKLTKQKTKKKSEIMLTKSILLTFQGVPECKSANFGVSPLPQSEKMIYFSLDYFQKFLTFSSIKFYRQTR